MFREPVEVAAAYLFYLCRNHPFIDGNKRTALATCLVFLSENGLLKQDFKKISLGILGNQNNWSDSMARAKLNFYLLEQNNKLVLQLQLKQNSVILIM